MNYIRKIFTPESASTNDLREWRARILDGILRGVFGLWLFTMFSGISNVLAAYRKEQYLYEKPILMAASVIVFYMAVTAILAFISFNRTLRFEWRVGLFLFTIYALGTIGFSLSSFSGDGRVFLFAFIILSAVFFDLRLSLSAFIFTLLTLVVLGWLQVSGIVFIPVERQVNAANLNAWVSGGLVLMLLSIGVLIPINYLFTALGRSLSDTRELLQSEQRLSKILRTVSEVNQLIVRTNDPDKLLMETCKLLVADRGYQFTWIGLLEPGQDSFRLSASAGLAFDPVQFALFLEQTESKPECAVTAFHTRSIVRVGPEMGDDICLSCPVRGVHPYRNSLIFPLLRNETVFGVLAVGYSDSASVFDDKEVALLKGLADDLSFALEKLKTDADLETRVKHQTLLAAITNLGLEAPTLDHLLQDVAGKLRESIGADESFIVLWDDVESPPVAMAASGALSDVFLNLDVAPEEARALIQLLGQNQPLVMSDAEENPPASRRLLEILSIRSLIGLPLVADGKWLGGVFLVFHEPHRFIQEEMTFIEQAAAQVALSVAKIRLNLDTQSKAAELAKLYAAAQDMAASFLDPQSLLQKLARHMTEALNVSSGNIVAADSVNGVLRVMAEYWGDGASSSERCSDLGREYPWEDYRTIIESMNAGKVLVLNADSEEMTEPERLQFEDYGIQTMMFVPIMAHGQLFGDIELWESRFRREFSISDVRLAQAMALQAAGIIESANLVDALRASETRYRMLVEQASDGIFLADPDRHYVEVNSSGCAMLGYTRAEILSMHIEDLSVGVDPELAERQMKELREGKTLIMERELICKDGSTLPVEISARFLPGGLLQGIVRDVSERKRAEAALAEKEAYYRALIENSAEGVAIIDAQGIVRYLAPSEERLTGFSVEEIIGGSAFKYIHPDDVPEVMKIFSEGASIPGAVRMTEYRLQRKDGEWRYFEVTGYNMLEEPHISGIVVNYRDVTERKRAEQALQESQSRLQAVIATALNGIITIDEKQCIVLFNPSAENIFGYSAGDVIGKPLDMLIPTRYQVNHSAYVENYGRTKLSARKKGMLDSLYGRRANGEEFPMEAFISHSDIGGYKFYTVIFQDITERKRAEDDLHRHAMELEALAAASFALRTAQNVAEMVPILARHAIRAVNGDYASIFLLDQQTNDFVSHGWYALDDTLDYALSDETSLRHLPHTGITGHVASTGEIYITQDIHKDPVILILDGERERLKNVHGGISLPLRNEEKTIGVMHIWSLESRIFTDTEIRLLIALAETASNAIHRAILFEKTLEHAGELSQAYDNTLAGWARALELRDELTEGHTRRVTELTLKLARAFNIPESDITQIRRGALLHDIGKMAIPDAILHKPGPLTAQEMQIMKMHPQYAYDMLFSIPFLHSALDIPSFHHEKWDGTGYPHGLKETAIPLAARIFSVADVWDALTSDRPYRKAWEPEKAREYIRERSGRDFDPQIVETFLKLEIFD